MFHTESLPVPVLPWWLAPLRSPWWSPGTTCSWQLSWCRWRCLHWLFQRRHTSCPASPSSWFGRTWSQVAEWQPPGRCFCPSHHFGESGMMAYYFIIACIYCFVFVISAAGHVWNNPLICNCIILTTCWKRLWTWILPCMVQRSSSWSECTPEDRLPVGAVTL